MPRKFRPPRVSAAYAALLLEALDAGGRLTVTREGAGGVEPFRQRLLRANVLVQLELLRVVVAPPGRPSGMVHVFALTPSGEALARGAEPEPAVQAGPLS